MLLHVANKTQRFSGKEYVHPDVGQELVAVGLLNQLPLLLAESNFLPTADGKPSFSRTLGHRAPSTTMKCAKPPARPTSRIGSLFWRQSVLM
jgi:hypothetical protein